MMNKRYDGFDFLKKNFEIFFGQGQDQVQAHPGFHAEKLTTRGVQGDVGIQAVPVPQLHLVLTLTKNQIHHIACAARNRAACCINICVRKGVSQM